MHCRRAIALIVFVLAARPVWAAEPVVSLWYRGTPAGTPRLDDLAAIRAVGFRGVTWPSANVAGFAELTRLANVVGLTVVVQPAGVPLDGRLDVAVTKIRPAEIPAIVWRAVTRGVRTVSFDPGQKAGTGLNAVDGRDPAWLGPAVAVARELGGNAPLFGDLRPGLPLVFLSARPASLDVTLFEGPQCWVIVATNTGGTPAETVARLPVGVPYAIWVSLIDGSTIAMPDRPTGAEWAVRLAPGEAAAYVIDKSPR
jgi:hypothetical protein